MPAKAGLDLNRIRAAIVNAAKEMGSVRRIADEVGLSYTALRWFIGGGKPQTESQTRLVAWYVSHRTGGSQSKRDELALATQLLAARVGEAKTPLLKRKRVRELLRGILAELDEEARRAFTEEVERLNPRRQ